MRAASRIRGCPIAYPTRRPASPNAFEKVRRTTTFGCASAGQHAAAVHGVGVGHELDVRLVEDHEHVARNRREEGVERRLGDDGAGRVVRTADDHDPGAVGDRSRHRDRGRGSRRASSGTCTGSPRRSGRARGTPRTSARRRRTSSPGPAAARISCARIETLPAPTCTDSVVTSNRAARRSRRRVAAASGYRLKDAASRTASRTPGSGSNGFSLLDSLKAPGPACVPCLYGGSAAISGRMRTGSVGHRPSLRSDICPPRQVTARSKRRAQEPVPRAPVVAD